MFAFGVSISSAIHVIDVSLDLSIEVLFVTHHTRVIFYSHLHTTTKVCSSPHQTVRT